MISHHKNKNHITSDNESENEDFGRYDYLTKSDFFGYQSQFNFHKAANKHQTIFGGICSILILIFMVFYFFVQISKFWLQTGDYETIVSQFVDFNELGKISYPDL